MKRYKKIYALGWERWPMGAVLLIVWLAVTYGEFFVPGNVDKLGLPQYIAVSIMLWALIVYAWLLGTRKLPIGFVEEEEEE